MCRNVRGKFQKIAVWFLRSRLLAETFARLPFALGAFSGFYSERWLIKGDSFSEFLGTHLSETLTFG